MLIAAILALVGAGMTHADPPPAPFVPPSAPVVPPPAPFVPPPDRDPGSLPPLIFEDQVDHCVPKIWAEANYLFYFLSPARYPQPFLTTSPPSSLGILGQNGTQVVIGGDVDYQTFNGFRFYSGGWFNGDRTFGSDGEMIFLEQRAKGFAASSDGSALLARPAVNALNGSPASVLVAFPGFVAGNLVFESRAKLNTGDGNLIFNLVRDEHMTLNALLGYRYLYFREEARVIQNQQFLAPGVGFFLGAPLPAGATMTILDRIECVNNVYLLQLGLDAETTHGRIVLSGHAKVGLGWADQRTFTDGRTTVGTTTVPGGILVQTTIPYRNYADHFAVVPDFGGQFGYQISPRWRLVASYDLMYVSNVARPGPQIDPTINPNQVPSFAQVGTPGGPARPTWTRNTSDLFVHGVQFGIAFRW
jgi:hypothetical protein